jgi:hypothetical protein
MSTLKPKSILKVSWHKHSILFQNFNRLLRFIYSISLDADVNVVLSVEAESSDEFHAQTEINAKGISIFP